MFQAIGDPVGASGSREGHERNGGGENEQGHDQAPGFKVGFKAGVETVRRTLAFLVGRATTLSRIDPSAAT